MTRPIFRKIERFLDDYFGKIQVIIILAMLCYLIGVILMLYYGMQEGK
ncbi:MAG: hypothetical protein P8Z38_11790 [Robiginitalea sp.]